MSKTRIFLTLCAFLASAFWSFAQDHNTFKHTIERGQTVFSIAVMYNVSTADIHRLNPNSKEVIKAGDILEIPQPQQVIGSYTFHTIQAKETLYSLSKHYGVSGEMIVEANPGLSSKSFLTGKIIRIPIVLQPQIAEAPKEILSPQKEYDEHIVQRRETMYSLCKKFNIDSQKLIEINPDLKKGVKRGMTIRIPRKQEEVLAEESPKVLSEEEVNSLLTSLPDDKHLNSIKVSLLLPFNTEKGKSVAQSRFVEYYEGLLLAIEQLQKEGSNIELSVFDTKEGTEKLYDILESNTLKSANLIIGAVNTEQIAPIAAFAQENNIKYVIPFTSKNDDVLSNSLVFQVNTPQSYLYDKAVEHICELHKEKNIILVDTKDEEPKTEFIDMLKREMIAKEIAYKEITYDVDCFLVDIEPLLELEKVNVVLPLSGSLEALNKIRVPIRALSMLVTEERPTPYALSLQGYPEWQTYTGSCLEDFFELGTHIYSNFYSLNMAKTTFDFYKNYRHWYSKDPMNTFPKYAMLGYDTGMFFLKAIIDHGTNFENSLEEINYEGVQTNFKFTRVNNWGGYINTNIFSIHYSRDFSITRNVVD